MAYKVIKLILAVHDDAKTEDEEVHAEDNLEETICTDISLIPEVHKVRVAIQEEVGRYQCSDVHVNGQSCTTSGEMIHQYDKLHPSFPVICLISMH